MLIVDEIGKNISGDGADPNVTGRYPTTAASGGPSVERMVYLGLTEETGGNANGLGMADVVTERLAGSMDRPVHLHERPDLDHAGARQDAHGHADGRDGGRRRPYHVRRRRPSRRPASSA